MSFRFDRNGTLYVVAPIRRILAGRGTQRIPILMYHSVADEDQSAVRPYYRTATTPSLFLQHLTWLQEQSYRTVGLASAVNMLHSNKQTCEKIVVITFDDGYRNFCYHAWPVLKQHGFTATIFLPTALIGDHPRVFNRRECMTWADVRALQEQGISFGSHTATHPQLHGLAGDRIREEVLASRKTIEDRIGVAVDSFAYPYAFPQVDEAFKKMLRVTLEETGYRYGVCTQIGRARTASDQFFLERLPINSGDDIALLQAKMDGDYDWVGDVQSLAKRFRKTRFKR